MSFASFAAAAIESSGARQSSQRMTLSFSLRPTRATEAAAPDLCAIFGATETVPQRARLASPRSSIIQ